MSDSTKTKPESAAMTPDMPANEAARAELNVRLRTVERLLKAMATGTADDVRSVHQLRVGTRRAAAALSVFDSCLKQRRARKVRRELRRIRRLANDVRQCDVDLDLLERWPESMPVEHQPLVPLLERALRHERTQTRKLLRRFSESDAPRELRRRRRRLLRPLEGTSGTEPTVSEVSNQALARRVEEFTQAAGADLAQGENLHALRIAGKRLRYSLETLEPLLPNAATIARERIVQLQDRLGEINDLTEFVLHLEQLLASDGLKSSAVPRRPRVAFDWPAALGQLIESARCRTQALHETFLGEWARGEWSDLGKALSLLGGLSTPDSQVSDSAPIPPVNSQTTQEPGADLSASDASRGNAGPDSPVMKKIAAIDVGTNSIRLVIAEAFSDGRLRVIDDERAMTRLGQGLAQSKKLSKKAMEESVIALAQFKAIAEGYRVNALKAVATCAVREARNGREFVSMVRQQAGVSLEVISAETEARLAFRSVCNAFDLRGTRTAVVDIGGGSTEIILGSGNLIEQIYPIPLGAVRLTEKFRIADDVPEKKYEQMRDLIRKTMRQRIGRLPFVPHMVIGTGGTFTALAAVAMQRGAAVKNNDMLPFTVRGYELQRSELMHILDQLRDLSLNGRLRVPGVSPERADIIVAGLSIVDCALKELQVNTLRVHDQGIRAGLLHSMADELFPADDRKAAMLPDRIREVRQFAAACNFEQPHAEHVANLSLAIFDELARELGDRAASWATAENRELLQAAALVHDVGYFINYSRHHKHTYHLVMHSDLDAFTHRQREIIANVGRYHRGANPKNAHPNLARLSRQDQELVRRLSAILRLADGLDRSHTQQVKSIEVHCHEGVAFMRLCTTGDASVDVWGSMRKGSLFEEMFNLKVRFSCVAIGQDQGSKPADRAMRSAVGQERAAEPRIERAAAQVV